MLKKLLAAIALAVVLVIPVRDTSRGSQVQTPGIKQEAVICSVMETFEEGKLGARAIIFHQRDKADGPRLGSLLLAHSGKEMELVTKSGRRYRATVFRVKSCFGRGLVMVPKSKFSLGEHEDFTLRFPGSN